MSLNTAVYRKSNGDLDLNANLISNTAFLRETSTPTPIVNAGAIYVKTDKNLYYQDEDSVEYILKGPDFSGRDFVIVGSSNADYVTDGTDDNVQIQQAIDYVESQGGGIVLLRTGTYLLDTTVIIPGGVTLQGENQFSTVLKMEPGKNLTVLRNKNQTTGDGYICIRNLTIDQDGLNQLSGGGGFTGTYITDSLWQDITINTSYNFNFLVTAGAGTTLTGTATFTLGNQTISGVGTLFLTELAVGDVVKSAGGRFGRIRRIVDDLTAIMDFKWQHVTEAGVTLKRVPKNLNNRIINCTFNGSLNTDNVGLGIFVDSLIMGNVSRDSGGGYGFGPDHCHNIKFIGNSCINNDNSGIGAETCTYCVFEGNECNGNGNGIWLLTGSRRNIVANNVCRENSNGIKSSYFSTLFAPSDENTIVNNVCEYNINHGILIAGVQRCVVQGNRCLDNGLYGITLSVDNGADPTKNLIINNIVYDAQDTKTQNAGIKILNGTDNTLSGNIAYNAEEVTIGISDDIDQNHINDNKGFNPIGFYNLGNVSGITNFYRTNGDVQTATLTGSITIFFEIGRVVGDKLKLILKQDAIGGHTAVWSAGILLTGGTLTISLGANAIDAISFVWNGTNWIETSRSLNVS